MSKHDQFHPYAHHRPLADADLFMAVDGFPIIADLRKVALTRR